jgi:predicted TIM-barrel fold metal-dependent hydrolase
VTDYLGTGRDALRRRDLNEVLDDMAAAGVERAIVDFNLDAPSSHTLALVNARPDKFSLAARLDPRGHVLTVKRLREFARDQPVVMARIIPFLFNLPPTASSYYPIYLACVELGLPISVNTGIPGPAMPAACQDPLHLDRVCLDFPELTVIMAHGADPWWDVAIRLMIKYPNLYLMTSAYRPKYLPRQLIAFMSKRNSRKIIFASDYPALAMRPLVDDAAGLGLSPQVLNDYLYANAARAIFKEVQPEPSERFVRLA